MVGQPLPLVEPITLTGISGAPGEGSYVILWITVDEGVIQDAKFKVPGCPSSIAAASMTVRVVKGRTVEQALRLDADDLLKLLGGLPDGRGHLADMCVEALRDALGVKNR
jgi:NifU-like protein involved in Fe-S cluster formation